MSATAARASARRWAADVLALLALGLCGWLLPALAARHGGPVLLNLGPNDAAYVEGFREDWERDRLTRFHWTTLRAAVRLPILVRGHGHVLRMRVRRHFVEPARITVQVEGRTAGAFDIAADTKVPYRVVEVPLPALVGRTPLQIELNAASVSTRPLGVAIDWLEVVSRAEDAERHLMYHMRLWLLAILLTAFLAPRMAGASVVFAAVHAALLLTAITALSRADVLALQRMAVEGGPAYLGLGIGTAILLRLRRVCRGLGLSAAEDGGAGAEAQDRDPPLGFLTGALVTIVLVAATLRIALLLHPQFYYPDVRIHALFAWQLARHGLWRFLEEFTANQFRFSLGLQFENGHWYAFPYPPVFYVLTWPFIKLGGYRPEVAVSVLAAVVNSLEALLVFGIARRLRQTRAIALGAAAVVPFLPLFLARLSLAYFPALVGHAVDAAVILYLLSRMERLDLWRTRLVLALLLAGALLTYTQSLLNFALLLPLFLVVDVLHDRTAAGRRRQAGLFVAGALGALLSVVIFYGRYVPTFVDMRRGIPMAEESIVLEKFARATVIVDDVAPQDPDIDPYTGADLDLWRGVRKATWRLVVFYGPFAPVIVLALGLLLWQLEGAVARFAAVWAASYLLLNLASGGLPGPNLVRYNKDLEIVAPLFCVALATLGGWLAARARWAAVLLAAAFASFGVLRGLRYLAERIVLER